MDWDQELVVESEELIVVQLASDLTVLVDVVLMIQDRQRLPAALSETGVGNV